MKDDELIRALAKTLALGKRIQLRACSNVTMYKCKNCNVDVLVPENVRFRMKGQCSRCAFIEDVKALGMDVVEATAFFDKMQEAGEL